MDFFSIFNKKHCLAWFITFFAFTANAQDNIESFYIERLPEANIFASINDELPAVLNYFTPISELEIISFYKEKYGDIVSQELKYKRLTLVFHQEKREIRIAISKQNNKHQVDVILLERI